MPSPQRTTPARIVPPQSTSQATRADRRHQVPKMPLTCYCAPDRTRTCDPPLRRRPLYPTELQGLEKGAVTRSFVRLDPRFGAFTQLRQTTTFLN